MKVVLFPALAALFAALRSLVEPRIFAPRPALCGRWRLRALCRRRPRGRRCSPRAKAGELDEVAKLLAGGADPNQRTDEHWTPLIMGAKGHLAIVNLLLEKGATPRPPDGARHTPLRGAAMFGHVEVVRRLLDARADVNQPSVDANS